MTTLIRLNRHVRDRDRSIGQSIVELALVLPVVLLILMVGLDFGRVFLGWVNLNNTARIAANFAATNATALTGVGPIHDNAIDRYEALIAADATAINCELPDPIPEPTYPGGTGLGQLAHVAIDCDFGVLTPIISNIMGNTVTISASSNFPIRNGIIAGVPTGGGGGSVNAAFNISPVSGVGSVASPLHVTYTDVSTGSPTSYQWDLNGDTVIDSTQVGNSPSLLTFDFTVPGVYKAKLTVSNGISTSFATQTITVNPPPGPVVSFLSNPVGGTAPLSVTFTNSSTGSAPLTYDWDFGDGKPHDTSKNTTHTFTSQGTYTVTLTVTDSASLSNAGTATITVTPVILMCTVPDFRGLNSGNNIQGQWNAYGFATNVIFSPGRPPEYTIFKQQLAKNSSQPCATAVQTVFDK